MKLFDLFDKTNNNSNSDMKSEQYNEYSNVITKATGTNFVTAVAATNSNNDELERYKNTKDELIKSLLRLNEIFLECGYNNKRLIEMAENLKNNIFQIVVLGEFSRGKSTFINALLHKNILPSSILPTTAVLTKIYYGKDPKVKINYYNNTSKLIELNDLKKYITSLETEELVNQIVDAEIYYPTQFCQDGCSIIDTPGVNDINQQKVDITYNYIPKSDAAIILLDPDQPFTQSEKEFIENKIIDNKIEKLFFVLNKFDLIEPIYVKETVNHVKSRILSLKDIDTSNINFFCLSSKEALKARLRNEDNEFNSEFKKFENNLIKFLVNEKGNYIILNAVEKGKLEIKKLEEVLSVYLNTLKVSVEESDKRKAEFEKIKVSTLKVCNDVKSQLDFKYKKFQSDNEFSVDMKLTEVFDMIYNEISLMKININNYSEVIPKIFESQMVNFVNNDLFPNIVSTFDEIKKELHNVLYNHKQQINQFNKSMVSTSDETAVTVVKEKIPYKVYQNENMLYIPENTNKRDVVSTITYAGGAITTGILIATMVSGPIGLLLAVLAGGAVFKTLDNTKIQRDKNYVYNRLDEIKGSITLKTKSKIRNLVKDEYEKIEASIYSEIKDNLDTYEKIFNDLVAEKNTKDKEFYTKEEYAKNVLSEIEKIKQGFDKMSINIRG